MPAGRVPTDVGEQISITGSQYQTGDVYKRQVPGRGTRFDGPSEPDTDDGAYFGPGADTFGRGRGFGWLPHQTHSRKLTLAWQAPAEQSVQAPVLSGAD